MHLANLMVRCEVVAQLGMDNLPASAAFFSSVDVDTVPGWLGTLTCTFAPFQVMRKEPGADCVTPSNPLGLEKGHGVGRGEGLDIRATLAKVMFCILDTVTVCYSQGSDCLFHLK